VVLLRFLSGASAVTLCAETDLVRTDYNRVTGALKNIRIEIEGSKSGETQWEEKQFGRRRK